MHQVKGANPFALTIFLSLWCSPANMPASHAGDHRSEAGQGRHFHGSLGRASRLAPTIFDASKALSAMHLLGKQASLGQFRVGAPFP